MFGGICDIKILQQLIDEVDTDHDNQVLFDFTVDFLSRVQGNDGEVQSQVQDFKV